MELLKYNPTLRQELDASPDRDDIIKELMQKKDPPRDRESDEYDSETDENEEDPFAQAIMQQL